MEEERLLQLVLTVLGANSNNHEDERARDIGDTDTNSGRGERFAKGARLKEWAYTGQSGQ